MQPDNLQVIQRAEGYSGLQNSYRTCKFMNVGNSMHQISQVLQINFKEIIGIGRETFFNGNHTMEVTKIIIIINKIYKN